MLCRSCEVSIWTLNGELVVQQDVYVEGDDLISACAFFEGNGNEYLERQLIFTGHKRGVVNVRCLLQPLVFFKLDCTDKGAVGLEHSNTG